MDDNRSDRNFFDFQRTLRASQRFFHQEFVGSSGTRHESIVRFE